MPCAARQERACTSAASHPTVVNGRLRVLCALNRFDHARSEVLLHLPAPHGVIATSITLRFHRRWKSGGERNVDGSAAAADVAAAAAFFSCAVSPPSARTMASDAVCGPERRAWQDLLEKPPLPLPSCVQ